MARPLSNLIHSSRTCSYLFLSILCLSLFSASTFAQSLSEAKRSFRRAFSENNPGRQKKAIRQLAATGEKEAFQTIGDKLANLAERLYNIKKTLITAHRKNEYKESGDNQPKLDFSRREKKVLELREAGRIDSLKEVFNAGAKALRNQAPVDWRISFVTRHALQGDRLINLFLVMKSKLITSLSSPGSRDAVRTILDVMANVQKTTDRRRSRKRRLDQKIYSIPVSTEFKNNQAAKLTTRRLKHVLDASILDALRKQIYTTLADVRDEQGVDVLLNSGLTSSNPEVRAVSAYALGAQDGSTSGTALKKRLAKESSHRVKIELLKAIGRRVLRDAADVVASQLSGTEMPAQFAAPHVLSHVGTMDHVPPLIDRLEQVKNGRVAREIIHSLEYMTGQSFGHRVVQWRSWWKKHQDETLKPPQRRSENLRKVQQKEKDEKRGGAGDNPATQALFYETPIDSNRVLFVIDVSKSMHSQADQEPEPVPVGLRKKSGPKIPELPSSPNKMKMAKHELMKAVKGLRKDQLFNIAFFAAFTSVLDPNRLLPAVPEVKKKTFKFIQSVEMRYATVIFDALELGFRIGDTGSQPVDREYIRTGSERVGPDSMYLLTDGKPAYGQYDPKRNLPVHNTFIEKLNRMNQYRLMKIHGIHIGKSGAGFLEKLVSRTLYYPHGKQRPDWWIRPGTFKAK